MLSLPLFQLSLISLKMLGIHLVLVVLLVMLPNSPVKLLAKQQFVFQIPLPITLEANGGQAVTAVSSVGNPNSPITQLV